MRPLSALLCLIAYCLLPSCLSGQVMAQTTINHCIGANGGAVFSDQSCAALQATPVGPDKPTTNSAASPGARALRTRCAASIDKLRQSVIEAFAQHDANRLAGLILWDSYSQRSVSGELRSLDELTKASLLDITMHGMSDTNRGPPPAQSPGGTMLDPFATAAAPVAASDANQMVLHAAGHDGPQERHFDLVRRAGCVWLRIAD
jgi:hypothetical protein